MKNNKPMFPIVNNNQVFESGITVREYYAGKALQGLVSNPTYFNCNGDKFILEELIFKRAFEMADGMLKQSEL